MDKHTENATLVATKQQSTGSQGDGATTITDTRENAPRSFKASDLWSIRRSARGFRIHDRKPRL